MSSLVGKQIGNYEVKKLLGEGGMGAVYLGEHPLIGKRVAIKALHDELSEKKDIVERFFTEAKAVNDIHHENIVDIVDFGKFKDEAGHETVYFVMEFLDGEALSDRIKRGPLQPADAIRIIRQAASALAASHTQGIVHRDLKPDNIFLVHRGNDNNFVKLLDFGIAKLTTEGSNKLTRAGSILGTPAYMSPEQCDGRGNIDHRSDIYSLGIVLFELLTGRVPFQGDGFGEILVAQITVPPPPPSSIVDGIPPELESIVLCCLEKDRERRFQTMDDLNQALAEIEDQIAPIRHITGPNRIVTGPHRVITGSHNAPSNAPTFSGHRPTTLSGSAGQRISQITDRPRSKAPLWIGLSLAVVGAVVGGTMLLRPSKKPIAPPVTIAAAPPVVPKIENVHVLIDSTPSGAKIIRAGGQNPIGVTPFELTLKKGDSSFDVMLNLSGYKPSTRAISTDRDRDVLVALEKEELQAPPVLVKPKPHPVKSRGAETNSTNSDKHKHIDPDGVLAPQL